MKHLGKFASQPFATCEGVITEACFHLASGAARARLRALLTELDVTVLEVAAAAADRDLAIDWLEHYAEHEADWADACLVVLSDRDGSARIWTYDREFRTRGGSRTARGCGWRSRTERAGRDIMSGRHDARVFIKDILAAAPNVPDGLRESTV